jgi:hypothetical protein
MTRKTRGRKTHRSKSHKRRHSRKHTRKNGGGCGCAMRSQFGGRGGMGGAELGHAFTTGASQELYQITGKTPGLSSGGSSKAEKRRRNTRRALIGAQKIANRIMANRQNSFKNKFVYGMPIVGYEGNNYKYLSRNEIKNKIREEALSKYVTEFGNNEGFNEIDLELNEEMEMNNNNNNNSNNNNNYNNMGNVIIPADPKYKRLLNSLRKTKRNRY